jgi:membrane-bound lytic murein transglycosylase A
MPQLVKRKATASELRKLCDGLINNKKPEKLTARQWFESKFDVWQVVQEDGQPQGLLTGYFEPMLKGSRQKQGAFRHPLFPVPPDLITVDLGDVYPNLKGMRLRGRLEGNKLLPYPNRAQWETLGERRTEPLVWVDDALDAFLLQVQGSGRIELEGGQTVRLGYADQNGHPYVAIGKVLVNRGAMSSEEATIPGIRKWAQQNPKDLPGLLNENPSVVFFRESALSNPNEGPNGSLGVPLSPEQSIAVDPSTIPLGSPVFVGSEHPVSKAPYQRLALAQDTGGAIRGRVRADLFWGWGAGPGELAGVTRQPLRLWVLWPKGAAPGATSVVGSNP